MSAISELQTFVVAFQGPHKIASGPLSEVLPVVKGVLDADPWSPVLVFDTATSRQIDLDLRGTIEEAVSRLGPPPDEPETSAPKGPGRPRLGVVAREVTLLPRHWEWLAEQPGGASGALRRLVEEARKANQGQDRLRAAQESANRFLSAVAGNLAGYEEASRALFAGDRERFMQETDPWPSDLRSHARELADRAFGAAWDLGHPSPPCRDSRQAGVEPREGSG